MVLTGLRRACLPIVVGAILAGALPQAAFAQADARISKMESEIRALQRAVFPGGDQKYFEPEITANKPVPVNPAEIEVTRSALTDVLTRLDALESQIARLTAATEVNENALRVLEQRIASLEAPGASLAVSGNAPQVAVVPAVPVTPAKPSGVITPPDSKPVVRPAPTPAASGPSAERIAAVQAIAKPATGDRGEDEYTYGFRLWEAKFYPEAQQQLALYAEQYPSHRMISYGRNLLGRAFLDAGEPRRAATHFFDNYQADKQGARAGDSLLFLAESMIALKDTNRACIALAEFGDTYPALALGRLKGQYDSLRGRVDCN